MKTDPRTPGRRADVRSTLASNDLARRLGRLPLPREAIPRLTRFVEEEVARALAARETDSYTATEVLEALGDEEAVEKLRKHREERQRVEAIRQAGLHEMKKEDLEAVLTRAKGR